MEGEGESNELTHESSGRLGSPETRESPTRSLMSPHVIALLIRLRERRGGNDRMMTITRYRTKRLDKKPGINDENLKRTRMAMSKKA